MVSNTTAKAVKTAALNRQKIIHWMIGFTLLALSFFTLNPTNQAHACEFFVPDNAGNPVKGPSFDQIGHGFTPGLLNCGDETHRLMVITLGVDPSEPYIGVRDEPLFKSDITGPLETLNDIQISGNASVHILGRINSSSVVGKRRGFVRFATLCNIGETQEPLNCSWQKQRIKFRTTNVDTNADGKVDQTHHELSIYNGSDRLHMVSFWAPFRTHIQNTTADWIDALHAFGIKVTG